jgi:hypothetical protein
LLSRAGVFILIFKKLDEIDSEIGNEMLVALRCRILERRNKEMVFFMRFLQSSFISRVDNYDNFKAKETMQHLYGVQSSANTNTSATNIPTSNTSSAKRYDIVK